MGNPLEGHPIYQVFASPKREFKKSSNCAGGIQTIQEIQKQPCDPVKIPGYLANTMCRGSESCSRFSSLRERKCGTVHISPASGKLEGQNKY